MPVGTSAKRVVDRVGAAEEDEEDEEDREGAIASVEGEGMVSSTMRNK